MIALHVWHAKNLLDYIATLVSDLILDLILVILVIPCCNHDGLGFTCSLGKSLAGDVNKNSGLIVGRRKRISEPVSESGPVKSGQPTECCCDRMNMDESSFKAKLATVKDNHLEHAKSLWSCMNDFDYSWCLSAWFSLPETTLMCRARDATAS